jgi:hypothetical protein
MQVIGLAPNKEAPDIQLRLTRRFLWRGKFLSRVDCPKGSWMTTEARENRPLKNTMYESGSQSGVQHPMQGRLHESKVLMKRKSGSKTKKKLLGSGNRIHRGQYY